MEPWLTYDEFKTFFPSVNIPETKFDEIEMMSQDIIDFLTLGNIEKCGGFDDLSESQKEKVKKALAYQVQFIFSRGGVYGMSDADLNSESIGKYSYTKGTATSDSRVHADTVNGKEIHPLVRTTLAPTGLLYSGLSRCPC